MSLINVTWRNYVKLDFDFFFFFFFFFLRMFIWAFFRKYLVMIWRKIRNEYWDCLEVHTGRAWRNVKPDLDFFFCACSCRRFYAPAWKVRWGHLLFGSSVGLSVCPPVILFYGTPLLSYYAVNALYGVVISIYLVVNSIYGVVISICDIVISISDVVI